MPWRQCSQAQLPSRCRPQAETRGPGSPTKDPMSNRSGSYMLNSLLAMLERESYFSRVSPEKTTEFVSHVLGLAMDHDGNPGEVLDGIGERLGIARAGRASCSRAMSPCSRGSTSTTAGTGRNATRWYGWTLAAAASRSPACWAKDSNGRTVTSSWSFGPRRAPIPTPSALPTVGISQVPAPPTGAPASNEVRTHWSNAASTGQIPARHQLPQEAVDRKAPDPQRSPPELMRRRRHHPVAAEW